jgi:transglycosylase-like protein with SLT domain
VFLLFLLVVGLALAVVLARPDSASPAPPLRIAAARIIRAEFGSVAAPCFLRIARRESRYNPRAANWHDRHSDGSRGSFGLFQIGAIHRRAGETASSFARRMFNPWANAREAHSLYRAAGLRPWGGYC